MPTTHLAEHSETPALESDEDTIDPNPAAAPALLVGETAPPLEEPVDSDQ